MKMHLLLILSFGLMLLIAASGRCDEDAWESILGTAAEGAAEADSGIIGMTSEELESYAKEEEMAAGGDDEIPEVFIRGRRRLVLREIKFNSDWDCDPTAIPALVDQFRRRTGMAAQALMPRRPLTFDSRELLDWPFVFMSAHYAFNFSEAESKGLRLFVERGGFVHADDCLYGQTFGPAFQGEMSRIFPECEFAVIDPKHPVYGMIYKQKYTFSDAHETGIPKAYRNANPFLGVILNGYLSIVYSPQDLGCQWEISSPPTPSKPLGAGMHGSDMFPGLREAAYRIGINIIMYSLLH